VGVDDSYCFAPPFKAPFQSVPAKIGGCIGGGDNDYEGPGYANNWPGTNPNATVDAALHSTPIVFTSPLANGITNFDRVAFETNLPRIETPDFANNNCDRVTGAGCVNPPIGASFYPFYTTGTRGGQCIWQEGGAYIPGTTNTFGGSPTAAYGPLLFLTYATPDGPESRTNDFRNVLDHNPCPA
jgi:hypothetical protein